MSDGQWAHLFKSAIVTVVALLTLSCNSRREEPSLEKVKGTDARAADYGKSYFFDQKVEDLTYRIQQWNQMLVHLVEAQGTGEKQPILFNSIEYVLPVLKESPRGFFKKTANGWQKDVAKVEKLSIEKEIYLEKIGILLSEKDSSWTLTASGRYPKDQVGDLFVLKWEAGTREFRVESKQSTDNKFACTFNLKSSGEVERATCDNFVIFRMEGKDIAIDHLTYDLKKGFNGEGKVTLAKGQQEKWEIHSLVTALLPTPLGGEN